MKLGLRYGLSYRATVGIIAAIAVFCTVMSFVIGDAFVPFSAAALFVLFLLDRGEKKFVSLAASSILIVINVAFFLLTLFTGVVVYSVAGLQTVVLAAVAAYMFSSNKSKGDTVVALTVIMTVFMLVSLWLTAATFTGSFSLTSAFEFFSSIIKDIRTAFIELVASLSTEGADGVTQLVFSEAQAAAMFDSAANLLVGSILAFAFVMTGIMCKAFNVIALKCTDEPEAILRWRFNTTSIIAVFYCVLFLLNLFASGISSLFGIIISNLFILFMLVYAYVGVNVAVAFFSMRRSKGFALAMLIAGIIVFNVALLELLSVVGAVLTIIGNRVLRQNGNQN